jgi:hypothetical protein
MRNWRTEHLQGSLRIPQGKSEEHCIDAAKRAAQNFSEQMRFVLRSPRNDHVHGSRARYFPIRSQEEPWMDDHICIRERDDAPTGNADTVSYGSALAEAG